MARTRRHEGEWLKAHYHVHFTPTHSSWLNRVERWFALLTQRQIKRGSHCSVAELGAAIREFIAVHNQQPALFTGRSQPTRS